MLPADRLRLTNALQGHVARIAADLRTQMLAQGATREAALRLHRDEQVGEDFEVWTDLLSRRAAVLWVLKTVYVRVLEDRGLLQPSRLLDEEAQQLFERLAPNLGDTAFLRWIFRDLASTEGGLPELFSLQPAEVAQPSNALSRDLIAFWRHRDPDTSARWSFAEERFEGELMGDLYQELDPVVKARYALCQTPDFVRAFMLDRTLSPAIETFGADTVRLLDPACGSGHLLIDGFKRLFAATQAQHPDWTPLQVALHVLDRVVGTDINDYACGLARTRLVMTAAELAGVRTLAETGQFHPHIYWADGLEQVEREASQAIPLPALSGEVEVEVRASFTRSDVRKALKKVFQPKFHAVLANPPYIVESDEARKAYHRERIGSDQRYVSAYRQYSLASPFTERCFQLAIQGGFVGLIISNNFMKREFGKPLIERVLSSHDLTLVVDTSQAYIPFHGTPTVILFVRNQSATSQSVRAVMGKRGESGIPTNPAKGSVWSSILESWNQVGFENEFVSVADVPREILNKHPWSLGGGGAADLKQRLDSTRHKVLGDYSADIGRTTHTGLDEVFLVPSRYAARICENKRCVDLVKGDIVRDWTIQTDEACLFPYDINLQAMAPSNILEEHHYWKYRTLLKARLDYGETIEQRGKQWFEHSMFFANRFRANLSITFACVATHNHFVIDRGGKIFKQSALAIKLPPESTENDYLALLGLLNSSVACFWMKQVFYPKGSAVGDISKSGMTPENNRYDFAATGLAEFPIPPKFPDTRIIEIAKKIDAYALDYIKQQPDKVINNPENTQCALTLREALKKGEILSESIKCKMIFWQEELDWICYVLYGILSDKDIAILKEAEITPLNRPFAWNGTLNSAQDVNRSDIIHEYERRKEHIKSKSNLRLLENAVQKRPWKGKQGVYGQYDRTYGEKAQTALKLWLADRVEAEAKTRTRVFTLEHLVAALQDDARVLAVCEVLTGRRDFSLSTLVGEILQEEAVPSHPFHLYKPGGLVKRAAWERTWADQRREDAGEAVTPQVPPAYGTTDFLRPDYYSLRGKLDVPKERFTAYTEAPGRTGDRTPFGWAGWTPLQRLRALLALDETLENEGIPLTDRMGLLDSAWRLLPDAAREDAAASARLKAELQPLVGLDGPGEATLEDWKRRFPPPRARSNRAASRRRTRPEAESEES